MCLAKGNNLHSIFFLYFRPYSKNINLSVGNVKIVMKSNVIIDSKTLDKHFLNHIFVCAFKYFTQNLIK